MRPKKNIKLREITMIFDVILGTMSITEAVKKDLVQLARAELRNVLEDSFVASERTIGLIIEKQENGRKIPIRKIYILLVNKPNKTEKRHIKFKILNNPME